MSSKKKTHTAKLSLKRETLKRLTRALGDRELQAVQGGVPCTASNVPTDEMP